LWCCQWQIYIEAKEAVLGAPRYQGGPQIYILKKCCRIMIQRKAFNKMLMKLFIYFGYGAFGAPGGITVAWGLTRPKSGPGYCIVLQNFVVFDLFV